MGRLPSLPGGAPLFSPPSAWMFATRDGARVTRLDSSLPIMPGYGPWLHGETLRARVERPTPAASPGPDKRVTLGIIAAANAGPDVIALRQDCRHVVEMIVVALDTADPGAVAALHAELEGNEGQRCRVIGHPLENDYAAQRNRVQQAAKTGWVLQLDCDERLTPDTQRILPCIVDAAELRNLAAVGLTRRNMVEGIVSALYPDVQYRLLRRDVSFTRAVHEYPVLAPSQRSAVHLGAGIIHHLHEQRLDVREARYEGIAAGAGRPHDTALLRRPLEPGVAVTP